MQCTKKEKEKCIKSKSLEKCVIIVKTANLMVLELC